jgi:hypothetical protein
MRYLLVRARRAFAPSGCRIAGIGQPSAATAPMVHILPAPGFIGSALARTIRQRAAAVGGTLAIKSTAESDMYRRASADAAICCRRARLGFWCQTGFPYYAMLRRVNWSA